MLQVRGGRERGEGKKRVEEGRGLRGGREKAFSSLVTASQNCRRDGPGERKECTMINEKTVEEERRKERKKGKNGSFRLLVDLPSSLVSHGCTLSIALLGGGSLS